MRWFGLRLLPIVLVACSAGFGDAPVESALPVEDGPRVTPPAETVRLRVVASNLTSGDRQSYDPGHGRRILQGLNPDVILMQEFSYGADTAAELQGFVSTFGPTFTYARETQADIPNGVVSRYPILESGVWDDPETETREFVWARVDVPGPKDLWAVSVHFLTTNAGRRNTQARALTAAIKRKVPASDYLVVGGDLNTEGRGESCVRTLGELVRVTAPFPADASGNTNTNRNRNKPFDWVLADGDLEPLAIPVLVGSASFTHGLVFDTRRFNPLADVPPAQRQDSSALNMQHMAVVRDFALPVPPEPLPSEPADASAPDAGERDASPPPSSPSDQDDALGPPKG